MRRPLTKLDSDNSQGGKHAQSKGGILAKACEYLAETRNTNQRLVESIKQNEGVSAENESLSSQIEQLRVNYFCQTPVQSPELQSWD